MVPAQQYVGRFLATFKEFPPSQKPGSFSIDGALAALQSGVGKQVGRFRQTSKTEGTHPS